jgi:putative two-component system response regulator
MRARYGEKCRTTPENNVNDLEDELKTHPPTLAVVAYDSFKNDFMTTCQRLISNLMTPIFVITKSHEDETLALKAGAIDTLSAPINDELLFFRINQQLKLVTMERELRNSHRLQEQIIQQHIKQLDEMQDLSMVAMGSLAETRDPETGNHIRRTQRYVKVLAEALKTHPKFTDYFTDDVITSLFKSAPLHDIGKIGIPDHILLKPSKLNFDEFEVMKTHTTQGRDAIVAAKRNLLENDNFLTFAIEIAYSHHEMWNGKGYPEGLVADQIPISARLMSIADVYDALISRRVYKKGISHKAAVSMIVKSKGIQFDPDMVDTFETITDQFKEIAEEYRYTYKLVEH